MGYARSPFRDFERYLRSVVDLDEDDVQLTLKQFNSNFITYKIDPGIYTIKMFSEAAFTKGDHEGIIQINYDDISMNAKLNLTRFGLTFGTLRFDRIFFHYPIRIHTILGL